MLNISKTIENNLPILYTNEDIKKLFPPNSVTAQEKRTLKKFYPFSYLYLNLTKLKVLSVIAINVISAKIILYLIIHLGVTLLVEYIVLEVACHIATLI